MTSDNLTSCIRDLLRKVASEGQNFSQLFPAIRTLSTEVTLEDVAQVLICLLHEGEVEVFYRLHGPHNQQVGDFLRRRDLPQHEERDLEIRFRHVESSRHLLQDLRGGYEYSIARRETKLFGATAGAAGSSILCLVAARALPDAADQLLAFVAGVITLAFGIYWRRNLRPLKADMASLSRFPAISKRSSIWTNRMFGWSLVLTLGLCVPLLFV